MKRVPLQRGSLGWYRYRMFSGLIFMALGAVIAVEIALKPGPFTSKLAGYAFVLVAGALGVVRVQQYLRARSSHK